MAVFILLIHVKPDYKNPQIEEVEGAYVNCFIEADKIDLAETIALTFLKKEYWKPVTLEEGYEVTEEDYIDDIRGLEIFKQVLIDKELYTFHTYEKEEE